MPRQADGPVFGATDAVAQVKIRKEQERLRKVLADDDVLKSAGFTAHPKAVSRS